MQTLNPEPQTQVIVNGTPEVAPGVVFIEAQQRRMPANAPGKGSSPFGAVGSLIDLSPMDHQHPGPLDISNYKNSNGVAAGKGGNDTQAFASMYKDFIATGAPMRVGVGTYYVNFQEAFVVPPGAQYAPAPKMQGDGVDVTKIICTNSSGAAFNFDVGNADGTYNVQWMGYIKDLTLDGQNIGFDAIRFHRSYFMSLERVRVKNFLNYGIHFRVEDSVSGDKDACQWVRFVDVTIESCRAWGIIADNPASSAFNQTAYLYVQNVWVTKCGVNMGANVDNSGAGSPYMDPASATTVIPTSGGIKWKGQGLSGDNLVISECPNVGLYVYADGHGQAFYVNLRNLDCENNCYGVWIDGCLHFNVSIFRNHHSSTYVGKSALVVNGVSSLSDLLHVDHVDLLADATLCPNYVAFDSNANLNAIGMEILHGRWQTDPVGLQTDFGYHLQTNRNRTRFTEFLRTGNNRNYDRAYNINNIPNTASDTADGTS